jgi:hypothetical protein
MELSKRILAKQQIAVCESSEIKTTAKGNKEMYTMSLDGVHFELWAGKYFKAKLGDKFNPVVSIVPRSYESNDGNHRARNQAVVDWVLI